MAEGFYYVYWPQGKESTAYKRIRDLPKLFVFKQHIRQLDLNSLLAEAQCSNCTLL